MFTKPPGVTICGVKELKTAGGMLSSISFQDTPAAIANKLKDATSIRKT
jgi:hypothetical protein